MLGMGLTAYGLAGRDRLPRRVEWWLFIKRWAAPFHEVSGPMGELAGMNNVTSAMLSFKPRPPTKPPTQQIVWVLTVGFSVSTAIDEPPNTAFQPFCHPKPFWFSHPGATATSNMKTFQPGEAQGFNVGQRWGEAGEAKFCFLLALIPPAPQTSNKHLEPQKMPWLRESS